MTQSKTDSTFSCNRANDLEFNSIKVWACPFRATSAATAVFVSCINTCKWQDQGHSGLLECMELWVCELLDSPQFLACLSCWQTRRKCVLVAHAYKKWATHFHNTLFTATGRISETLWIYLSRLTDSSVVSKLLSSYSGIAMFGIIACSWVCQG